LPSSSCARTRSAKKAERSKALFRDSGGDVIAAAGLAKTKERLRGWASGSVFGDVVDG